MKWILIGALLILSGCSSLDQKQCYSADWYSLGLEDGNKGVRAGRINDYQQDCAKHAVTADASAWQRGYQQGLVSYCVPENGYRVGLAGQSYYGVCTDNAFVEQYNIGYLHHELNKKEAALNNQLERINKELSRIEDQLKKTDDKAKLLDKKNSLLDEKARLLSELRSLR